MATSTYMTFLMKGTGSGENTTYSKLLDITSFPDMGGAPEQIDVTTLSDRMRKYVPGIENVESLSFGANYDPADYAAVKALKDTDTKYAVWLGGTENADGTVTPTGSNGKFEFTGKADVYLNGGEVNGAQAMTVTVTPSSAIVKAAS